MAAVVKSLLLVMFSALAFVATPCMAQDACGATGDGCQSPDYQQLLEVAAVAFPDWPEVGYRTYAALCIKAKAAVRKECFEDPQHAAKSLKLPPEE